MAADTRQIKESPVPQGEDEVIVYTLDTEPYGGTPTGPAMTVWNMTAEPRVDVTATVAPAGAISVAGDVITLKPILSLTAEIIYRLEILFTSGVNTFEPWVQINGAT